MLGVADGLGLDWAGCSSEILPGRVGELVGSGAAADSGVVGAADPVSAWFGERIAWSGVSVSSWAIILRGEVA